jgi:hypothetical protein
MIQFESPQMEDSFKASIWEVMYSFLLLSSSSFFLSSSPFPSSFLIFPQVFYLTTSSPNIIRISCPWPISVAFQSHSISIWLPIVPPTLHVVLTQLTCKTGIGIKKDIPDRMQWRILFCELWVSPVFFFKPT